MSFLISRFRVSAFSIAPMLRTTGTFQIQVRTFKLYPVKMCENEYLTRKSNGHAVGAQNDEEICAKAYGYPTKTSDETEDAYLERKAKEHAFGGPIEESEPIKK